MVAVVLLWREYREEELCGERVDGGEVREVPVLEERADHVVSVQVEAEDKAGFEVDEIPVKAHRGKGARHLIWVARTPER